MEQQTHARHDESAARRRARLMGELIACGVDTGVVGETLKLGTAIAAGALFTLWITGPTHSIAGTHASQQVATPVAAWPAQAPISGPLEFTPYVPPAAPASVMADTPQRDVHSDGGKYVPIR